MAGNLFLPPEFDRTKTCPSVVATHPFGGVKEQTSGLYTEKLAEQGYIASNAAAPTASKTRRIVASPGRLEPTGQRITPSLQRAQNLQRRVRDPLADRGKRLRPASTAASNNDVSVCRTPRGSRGSGTCCRHSAGTLASQQHAVTGRQVPKLLQGSNDRDDDKTGTVLQQ